MTDHRNNDLGEIITQVCGYCSQVHGSSDPACVITIVNAKPIIDQLTHERDEAREALARGRFNAVWLVVGWCGLVEVYKHRADGFEGIESYVKLVRAMEKPSVMLDLKMTVKVPDMQT